jgi:hypothetical protein
MYFAGSLLRTFYTYLFDPMKGDTATQRRHAISGQLHAGVRGLMKADTKSLA